MPMNLTALEKTRDGMSHGALTQAKRDFKTLRKARQILDDPERKSNAHLLAEIKNEQLKDVMMPAEGENGN